MDLVTLNAEEVIRIHYILCADFAEAADPIGYGGLRSQALLESAVGRQLAGYGPFQKYPDPVSNAATLAFGVCCDHPFHNGNKRTALVSMLAHLDKNHLALKGTVRQDELYDVMLNLASRELSHERVPRRARRRAAAVRYDADHQVAELTNWLNARVERVTRGERPITYRQLRPLLKRHGYVMGQVRGGNLIEICKEETVRKGLVRRETTIVQKPIGRMGYRNEGEEVSRKTMKQLRAMCHLTEADGVDTESFYDGADVVDAFVNRYRTVLRRLANT
jgi:prophage maintenance system killer protein